MRPLLLAIIAALALAGCTEIVREPAPRSALMVDEPGGIVVQERPPVLREEIVPLAPGPTYAWHPGHWRWENGWVWAPGRYIARPHPEAVWVQGHWAARRYGWSWIPGHWD